MTRSVLEEQVYRSQFASGLLEAFVGLGLTLIGAIWLLGHVALAAIVPALLAVLWPLVRRQFIAPRAGRVQIRDARKRRERRGLILASLLGVLAFIIVVVVLLVFALESDSVASHDLVRAVPAGIVATGALFVAFALGIRRTWLYAVPLVLGAVLCVLLGVDPGWSLLGSGVAILMAGAVLLFDFARRSPAEGPE